jgi:hypothetical protein
MSVLLGDRNLRTYPPSTQRAFRISRRTTRPRPCTACGHVPQELRSGALKTLSVGYEPEGADLNIAYPRDGR